MRFFPCQKSSWKMREDTFSDSVVQALVSQGISNCIRLCLRSTQPADQRFVSPQICGSNLRKIPIPAVTSPTELSLGYLQIHFKR